MSLIKEKNLGFDVYGENKLTWPEAKKLIAKFGILTVIAVANNFQTAHFFVQMFCLDLLTFVCVRIEIAKNMLPSLGIKNPIFEHYGYDSVFQPCVLIFCMDGMAKVVLSYLCYKPILSFHQFLTGLGWPSGFVFVIRIRIQDLQLLLFSKYKQQQKTKFGLVVVLMISS